MAAPNSSEQKSEGEDINTLSEEVTASAKLVLDETSLDEVDEINLSENGQKLTSLGFPDLEFIGRERFKNILHCLEIMYTVINMCFKVSRYIESFYRHDDVLAVNNDVTRTLSISDLFAWLEKLFNEVKRNLKEKILPPFITYQEIMDHILYNLRAVAVNIDYNLLIPNSYQLKDYNLVFDNRQKDYREDDGGNQNDSKMNPFNQNFLKMELRRSYSFLVSIT